MAAQLQALGKGRFAVIGVLDFATVPTLHQSSAELFSQHDDLSIDLAAVERSDSSGVALLIDWLRQAQQQQQAIRFDNIPEQMQAIIRVADLTAILIGDANGH